MARHLVRNSRQRVRWSPPLVDVPRRSLQGQGQAYSPCQAIGHFRKILRVAHGTRTAWDFGWQADILRRDSEQMAGWIGVARESGDLTSLVEGLDPRILFGTSWQRAANRVHPISTREHHVARLDVQAVVFSFCGGQGGLRRKAPSCLRGPSIATATANCQRSERQLGVECTSMSFAFRWIAQRLPTGSGLKRPDNFPDATGEAPAVGNPRCHRSHDKPTHCRKLGARLARSSGRRSPSRVILRESTPTPR